jgi:hypothetical protein
VPSSSDRENENGRRNQPGLADYPIFTPMDIGGAAVHVRSDLPNGFAVAEGMVPAL